MNRMRSRIVILVFWLLLFFSIERLVEAVNIARVAYPLAPIMATAAILFPRFRQVPLWLLLVLIAPLVLLARMSAGYDVWTAAAFPLVVTEVTAIAITTILAYRVGQGIGEFEWAVQRITMGPAEAQPGSFADGQAQMYREVRRARRHQRPLSLLAIEIEEGSIQVVLDRMVRETQQALMKRYVLADVARALCSELEDYHLIAQADDCFLVLAPEVTGEDLPRLSSHLAGTVRERVGVGLKIGTASFPDDAVTFESLVSKATRAAGRPLTAEPRATVAPPAGNQEASVQVEGVTTWI